MYWVYYPLGIECAVFKYFMCCARDRGVLSVTNGCFLRHYFALWEDRGSVNLKSMGVECREPLNLTHPDDVLCYDEPGL